MNYEIGDFVYCRINLVLTVAGVITAIDGDKYLIEWGKNNSRWAYRSQLKPRCDACGRCEGHLCLDERMLPGHCRP